MNFSDYVAFFFIICIIAYPVEANSSLDLSLRVILPVIICVVVVVIIIICCCWYFTKPSEYELIRDCDFPSDESPSIENNHQRTVNLSEFGKQEMKNQSESPKTRRINVDQETRKRVDIESDKNQSKNLQDIAEIVKISLTPFGLKNVGSECYMNSAIQAFASSELITKFLEETKRLLGESDVLEILLNLIDNLNRTDGSGSIEHNSKLREDLQVSINWKKSNQQDVYDFMCAIINSIHNQIKEMKKHEIEPPLKSEIIFKTTGALISEKRQYNIGLSLMLCGPYQNPPGVKLTTLIEEHFKISNIDGDEKQTSQIFYLRQIPKILILHIQANKWDANKNEMIKPDYNVQYDEQMELQLPLKQALNYESQMEHSNFKLVAVISHSGSLSDGHYISHRKMKHSWILANDSQITFIEFNSTTLCPYLLIYERVEK